MVDSREILSVICSMFLKILRHTYSERFINNNYAKLFLLHFQSIKHLVCGAIYK